MAILNVGPGGFASIRDALTSPTIATGDTIQIASGTYDITATGYANSLAYSAKPYCYTGFTGVTSLLYNGAGKTSTTITGNARLFGQNVDGTAPQSVSYSNFALSYTSGSGYILSSTATPTININSVSFTGTHSGNAGASGNYADVRNVTSFTLSNSDVSLTGQAGFNGPAGTGGSSFLMLKGSGISITGNSFNESGYRNALSIFDSTGVLVDNNTFSRTSNRNVRSGGEKLKDTTGTVSNNKFFDGAYLAVEKISTGSVTVSNNTFAQFDPAGTPIPNPISGGGAVGIVLQGTGSATALGTVTGNTFSYVAPFSNQTSNVVTVSGASSNNYIDPITNATKNFNAYYVGGTGTDTLTGSSSPEYFIGGAGSDTINTAGGADYILFNTALSASNVDTITGFNSNSRIILDRKIFAGITATYDPSGTPVASSIGAVNNSVQVENNTTGTASSAATRIIFNTSSKELLYDPDGVGGTAATVFAVLTGYSGSMVGYNGSNIGSVNIGII